MEIVRSQDIPDVLILKPSIFTDERGRFLEVHRIKDVIEEHGSKIQFVQSNLSFSGPNVLRGIHFQTRDPQGKLMRCVHGTIQHIGVDLREGSLTYGKHVSTILDDIHCHAVWLPPGFGAGFLVIGSGGATVYYECSSYYVEEFNGAVNWQDPDIGIRWATRGRNPILSNKDRKAMLLKDTKPIRI